MIEKTILLKGSDAELLSRALAEVKTRIYNESEHRASDTEAIEALVYCFRKSENGPMATDIIGALCALRLGDLSGWPSL